MTDKNKNLFDLSQKFIPGGVNSPVRAFSSVGGTPIFLKKDKSMGKVRTYVKTDEFEVELPCVMSVWDNDEYEGLNDPCSLVLKLFLSMEVLQNC